MQENKLFKKINTSALIISAIWGAIVSLCLVLGYKLETSGSVFGNGIKGLLAWIALFIVLSFAAYIVNIYLNNKEKAAIQENEISPFKKFFLTCLFGAAIFVLWAPAFLAVYPGWFNYDAPWQIYMYSEGNISAHHPVLHTLLLGNIVERTHLWKVARGDYAYNYNSSVALYNVFQMFVCALGLGYQTEFIYERFMRTCKKGIRVLLIILTIAFFGLYPPIVLLAMSPTKDVLFGIFYMLLVIKVLTVLEDDKKPDVSFIILAVLCMIFRQNTTYVFLLLVIPFLIILFKRCGKKNFIRGVICVASAILVMVIYTGPFYKLMDIEPGSKAEFLSVPSQQFVSVYLKHGEELDSQDRIMLEKLFDGEAFEGYRPKLADKTKGNLKLDVLETNKSTYASLYFNLLKQYPGDFFDSFLILNYGLWYPDATMDLYEDGENLYFSTDYQLAIPSSKLPAINEYYMSFASVESGLERILIMPALTLYLALFSLLRGCKNKESGVIITGLATILIFATFLLGPCASIRYLYYIYILAPLLVTTCINRNKTIE